MFLLDGKPLSPDVPFTAIVEGDEIQFPANWLRLATPEEREAVGVTEVPDPAPYDQRFYWGYTEAGELIPKDHTQLVEQWTSQTRTTAGTLLAPTDWLVIREADNTTPVPTEWREWREAVRQATGAKVTAIQATLNTSELAAYVTSAAYTTWPNDPDAPAGNPPSDGIQFAVDGISSDLGLS